MPNSNKGSKAAKRKKGPSKMTIQIPVDLHRELGVLAAKEHTTVGLYVTDLLERHVKKKKPEKLG